MIDFRYHLVSIVAIFLALGLGLVLGSTALQPYVLKGLDKTSKLERSRIVQLYAAQQQLNGRIRSDDAFAQTIAHELTGHLLAGQRVVFVVAPGASSGEQNGISQLLAGAGAAVTGTVQLQSALFDTSQATQARLGVITQQVAPAGTTLNPGASPVAQAAQVLAGAILTRGGPQQPLPGLADSASTGVLTGFAAGGYLTISGKPAGRATLAVVIPPAAPGSASDSDPVSQGLVTFAQALQQAGRGTVVAGAVAGSGPGSAIWVMRNLSRAASVSTVDDADTTIGQIVVVLALADEMNGKSGSYGTTSTATSAGPDPVPSASPSPTATAPQPGTASTHSGQARTALVHGKRHPVPAVTGSATP